MKARIERERIPPGEDSAVPPQARARLAVGRRVHRAARAARARRDSTRAVRTPSTRGALDALVAIGAVCRARTRRGSSRRTCCASGRGTTATCSPARPAMRCRSTATRPRSSARMLGYVHRPQQTLARGVPARRHGGAREVVERIFYGREESGRIDRDLGRRRVPAAVRRARRSRESTCTARRRSCARTRPATVLDAGCGTGGVAIELARRGVEVRRRRHGRVDARDGTRSGTRRRRMGARRPRRRSTLGRTFDVVVMAGNVPLFTPKGTEAALVAGCAAHVARRGGPRRRLPARARVHARRVRRALPRRRPRTRRTLGHVGVRYMVRTRRLRRLRASAASVVKRVSPRGAGGNRRG